MNKGSKYCNANLETNHEPPQNTEIIAKAQYARERSAFNWLQKNFLFYTNEQCQNVKKTNGNELFTNSFIKCLNFT